MIRKLILVALALTASVMLPAPAFSQTGGVSLRWQLPARRKLNIEMTQQMRNSQDINGAAMSTFMRTTNFMTWEVNSFDQSSGIALVKSEIDRMTMEMKSPNGDFELDSDSDSQQQLTGMAKVIGEKLIAMVGKPFEQKMDARGEVLEIKFPEEFDQAAMAMGKDGMEKLIKNASPVFPREPIAVGHSWTQETTTAMPGGIGEMQLLTTYTYTGPETLEGKSLERIAIDMTMSFETPEGSQAAVDIIDQSTQGKMYFDAANGHTTSMEVRQSMKMNISFGGQEISQNIENVTRGEFSLAND